MTTITKERIDLFIKAPLENGLTRGEQMELARIALASLEAEPVAWRYRTTDINGNPRQGWSFSEEASLMGLYQPLYTAPPVPVVPDEWTIQDAVKFCRETGRQDAGSAMEAWNACRTAMLNGGKS
ncbi:Eaa protein [Salmonella enterica subsp. enterica serovar Newport]|nr:Eaa protein [Salmonella enterica subsp. enterica serovar Newport]